MGYFLSDYDHYNSIFLFDGSVLYEPPFDSHISGMINDNMFNIYLIFSDPNISFYRLDIATTPPNLIMLSDYPYVGIYFSGAAYLDFTSILHYNIRRQ